MPRIAIILGRLVIGGTTMDTLQVAQHLQSRHQVLLITGGGQKDEFEAAYLTEHLPAIRHERINGFSGSIHPIRDFRAYLALRRVLRKFKPQVVHTHTAKAGLLGRLAAASEKVPVIVHTYHGLMFHGYYNATISKLIVAMERWLAAKSTHLIALSPMQKDQLVNTYHICRPEKISVVPLGIELSAFSTGRDQKRKEFRQKYMLEADEVAIGIVGRIVQVKNHPFFIELVSRLSKQGVKARFFVIGDGQLRRRLQAQASESGIDQTYFPEEPRKATLTFTSWITEVDKAMAGLDIIALTSVNEGTPVSLMEAQASQRVVVATRAGGIDDIVKDGETGYTIDQGQIEAFAERLMQLISDPQLRQRMGEAAEAFANQRFRKDQQVETLHQLYLSTSAEIQS